MAASFRVLGPGDEAALEAFLAPRADSSLFLLSNIAQAGLADTGEAFCATYAAAFERGAITGVVGHAWNGNQIFQAERHGAALSRLAAETCGRSIKGLIGPWEQIAPLHESAALADKHTLIAEQEILYALALGEMRAPDALRSGALACRRARATDHSLIADWRVSYSIETLNERDSAALRAHAGEAMARETGNGRAFLLEDAGGPIAFSAFNAQLPSVVQVGGVWTPPALRGRGYGRAVVAGQLAIARDEGTKRGVLFTKQTNYAAQRAYESIGFQRIGAYGLIHYAA